MASGRVEKASPSAMGVRTRSAATGVEIVVPTSGRIAAVIATVPAAVSRSRSPAATARPRLWRLAAPYRSAWAVTNQVCARSPAPMAWSSPALPDTRAVTRATSARAPSRVCWDRVSSRQPRTRMGAVRIAMAAMTRPATGERAEDDRGHGACHEGRQDRHGDPDLRVHDITQVVDDPGQQVGPAATAKSRRRQRDEPFVCRGASVGEVGEGDVVRAQALPVAKDRPGHAEGAHGHDRGEQHEDDGAFAGAHDQPAGGGGQGDA